jgi:hypothetical protein
MFIIEKGYRFYTVGKKNPCRAGAKASRVDGGGSRFPYFVAAPPEESKAQIFPADFDRFHFVTERACVRDPSIIPNRQQYRALAISAVGGRRRRR